MPMEDRSTDAGTGGGLPVIRRLSTGREAEVISDAFGRVEVDEYDDETGTARVLRAGLPWIERQTYEPASPDWQATWPPLEPPHMGWSAVRPEIVLLTVSGVSGYKAECRWWNDETHAVTVSRPKRPSLDPDAPDQSRAADAWWEEVSAGSYRPQDRRAWPPLLIHWSMHTPRGRTMSDRLGKPRELSPRHAPCDLSSDQLGNK